VTPPDIQKCPPAMSLKASSCSLLGSAAHVSDGGLVCCRLTFFSLFSPENYNLALFVVGIST